MNQKRQEKNKQLIREAQEKNKKQPINLVVVGHVDAGKSTIMGNLLYLSGHVSDIDIHRLEKEAKKHNKKSFKFAYIFDAHEEERERGITIDVAVKHFETESKVITILDTPGHKDFIPNMISGAAQADVAILVVAASPGEFESGFQQNGQTKEHSILLKSLGVSQLIVAVNKLDTVNWSKERYDFIVEQLLPFLRQAGFKHEDICFVPLSGFSGENLLNTKEKALNAWNKSPPLIEVIDKITLPERLTDKPLRFVISDVFKSMSMGISLAGKVEGGVITVGDKVRLLPGSLSLTVKSIYHNGESTTISIAGDNIEIGISGISDFSVISVGQIICDPSYPVPLVKTFKSHIITLATTSIPIMNGSECLFHTQNLSEPVIITKIYNTLDKYTGAVLKKAPRSLKKNSVAIVDISISDQSHFLCLEKYSEFRPLGRFLLRDSGETIAVGIVLELYL